MIGSRLLIDLAHCNSQLPAAVHERCVVSGRRLQIASHVTVGAAVGVAVVARIGEQPATSGNQLNVVLRHVVMAAAAGAGLEKQPGGVGLPSGAHDVVSRPGVADARGGRLALRPSGHDVLHLPISGRGVDQAQLTPHVLAALGDPRTAPQWIGGESEVTHGPGDAVGHDRGDG